MVTKELSPFNNVVADGKATVSLLLGDTYNRIILVQGGTAFTNAMITRIECKLNGKPFYDLTGAQLTAINKHRGIVDTATTLTIDFTEPSAKTMGGQNMGRIGTAQGVSSLTIAVTIAGATAPTLIGYAMVSEPEPLGRILAMIPQEMSFAATGKNPVMLPYSPGASHMIKRIHFFGGAITALDVKKNGVPIHDNVPKAVSDAIQAEYGYTAQAGHFAYCPIVSKDMARVVSLASAQSLQLTPTIGTAESVAVIGEYLAYLSEL